MKKTAKKLVLAKETVRTLTLAELGGKAAGGTDTGTGYCGESYVCTGACPSDPLYVCFPEWEPLETTDC